MDLGQDLNNCSESTLSTEQYPRLLCQCFGMFISIYLHITEFYRHIGSHLVNILWLIRVYKHCLCMTYLFALSFLLSSTFSLIPLIFDICSIYDCIGNLDYRSLWILDIIRWLQVAITVGAYSSGSRFCWAFKYRQYFAIARNKHR